MEELDAISTAASDFRLLRERTRRRRERHGVQARQDPQDVGELPGGGHFGRTPDGKLNGLIYEEPALLRFLAVAAPPVTPELIATALASYTKQVAAAGNTTLHEPGTVKPDWVEPLAKLSNTLDVRMSASLSTDSVEASKAFASLGPAPRRGRYPTAGFRSTA